MRRWYSYGRYTTTHYLLTDNLGRFVYNTLLHLVLQWTLISSPPTFLRMTLPLFLRTIYPPYPSISRCYPQIPQLRTRSYPLSSVFFCLFFYLSRNESIRFGYKYDLDCFATDFFWFRPALLPPLHCIVLHIIPPHGLAFVTSPFSLLPLIPIPNSGLDFMSVFCTWWCVANSCRTLVHTSPYRLSLLFVDTLLTLELALKQKIEYSLFLEKDIPHGASCVPLCTSVIVCQGTEYDHFDGSTSPWLYVCRTHQHQRKGGTRSDLGERSAKVRTLEVSCRRKGENAIQIRISALGSTGRETRLHHIIRYLKIRVGWFVCVV